jgi:Na+/H+ antiporter NhaD/arsenite permease-like protein
VVEQVWSATAPLMPLTTSLGTATFSAAMAVASNLVSNVPLVLLIGPHLPGLGGGETAWVLTAFVVTVAGNLTLIGSVANIIVAEGAREHYALGFREYLRFGAVSTVVVTAIGVAILRLTT